jgi:serine/threonine-protein kinase HipA
LYFAHGKRAGILTEFAANDYHFEYDENLMVKRFRWTMPTNQKKI